MYDHARSRFRYDYEELIARSHYPEAERLYNAYRNAALALGVEIDPFDNDLLTRGYHLMHDPQISPPPESDPRPYANSLAARHAEHWHSVPGVPYQRPPETEASRRRRRAWRDHWYGPGA